MSKLVNIYDRYGLHIGIMEHPYSSLQFANQITTKFVKNGSLLNPKLSYQTLSIFYKTADRNSQFLVLLCLGLVKLDYKHHYDLLVKIETKISNIDEQKWIGVKELVKMISNYSFLLKIHGKLKLEPKTQLDQKYIGFGYLSIKDM